MPTSQTPDKQTTDGPLQARQSLGLWGDGDEVQLLTDLETTFAFKFDDADMQRMRTAGEVDDIIWCHFGDCDGYKCMSAMAFYQLRQHLRQHGARARISPSDRIALLVPSAKAFALALKHETGMQFDYRHGALGRFGRSFQLGWLIALGAGVAGYGVLALAMATIAGIGIAMIGIDRGRFAEHETVGDVSRRLAEQNYGFFARRGARISRQGVWEKVRDVMAEFQGLRQDEIGRDTVLIGQKYSVFSRE